MKFIAYTVTSLASGRVRYVGATTTSIAERWRGHKKKAKKQTRHRSPLHDAIMSHGANSFAIEHVASAWNEASLSELERLLVIQYDTLWPKGYNLKDGGQAGYRVSEVARQKMRGPRRSMTAAEVEANRLRNLGKKMPPDAIARTRAAHIGKIVSVETRQRQSIAAKLRAKREQVAGVRFLTAATREKLSIAKTAYWRAARCPTTTAN